MSTRLSITPSELADALSVHRTTVYKWIESEEINASQVGGTYRIFQHQLADKIGDEEARIVFKSLSDENQ